MRIRAATRADHPALAALMAASPLLRRYGMDARRARAALAEAAGAGDVLLVADGDAPMGLAWAVIARSLDRSAYLRLLLVDEDARSRGTGAALLARIERIARRAGARHLALLVTRDNRRARRFYERAGYRSVGLLPDFVRPGLDEVLYVKTWRR